MLKGKVLIAQGGGPTAVINQSLVGAVTEARKIPGVDRIYGAYHGVRGIINEDFIDLTLETTNNLEMVGNTPAAALGSTRDKPDAKYCEEILKSLRAHEIHTFFYTGGNDSSDTLRILRDQAKAASYPLQCVHIPKTIDNDLMVNDHRRAIRRRPASSRSPLPAPTSTTVRCRASTWPLSWAATPAF